MVIITFDFLLLPLVAVLVLKLAAPASKSTSSCVPKQNAPPIIDHILLFVAAPAPQNTAILLSFSNTPSADSFTDGNTFNRE